MWYSFVLTHPSSCNSFPQTIYYCFHMWRLTTSTVVYLHIDFWKTYVVYCGCVALFWTFGDKVSSIKGEWGSNAIGTMIQYNEMHKLSEQWKQHRERQRRRDVVRSVVNALRLRASLCTEKQQSTWKLYFGGVICEMALMSFLFHYASPACPHPQVFLLVRGMHVSEGDVGGICSVAERWWACHCPHVSLINPMLTQNNHPAWICQKVTKYCSYQYKTSVYCFMLWGHVSVC